MPISSYFFRPVHLAPEDALHASEDLGCSAFIPWGYGTFILEHDHVHEPLRRLAEAQKRLPPSFPIRVLKIGVTWSMDGERGPQTANLLKLHESTLYFSMLDFVCSLYLKVKRNSSKTLASRIIHGVYCC
jgi:hypothetical protein